MVIFSFTSFKGDCLGRLVWLLSVCLWLFLPEDRRKYQFSILLSSSNSSLPAILTHYRINLTTKNAKLVRKVCKCIRNDCNVVSCFSRGLFLNLWQLNCLILEKTQLMVVVSYFLIILIGALTT